MPMFILQGAIAATTTTYKSAIAVAATAGVLARGKILDMLFGANSVPNATDCPVQWDVSRITGLSTSGTAFVPVNADSADSTSQMTAVVASSTEGTVTAAASLFNLGLNQRNSARWTALDEAKALVWPALANNGVSVRALSPNYGGASGSQLMFLE